ncbi:hypothetical protein B0H14DRAFT_2579824 [Mycena olivaceomarginata]|nr:hypothetical protein B0H14DRAFT_2579824 [Mycena olivaceomarginata]
MPSLEPGSRHWTRKHFCADELPANRLIAATRIQERTMAPGLRNETKITRIWQGSVSYFDVGYVVQPIPRDVSQIGPAGLGLLEVAEAEQNPTSSDRCFHCARERRLGVRIIEPGSELYYSGAGDLVQHLVNQCGTPAFLRHKLA